MLFVRPADLEDVVSGRSASVGLAKENGGSWPAAAEAEDLSRRAPRTTEIIIRKQPEPAKRRLLPAVRSRQSTVRIEQRVRGHL
jgi:hypothetical protein